MKSRTRYEVRAICPHASCSSKSVPVLRAADRMSAFGLVTAWNGAAQDVWFGKLPEPVGGSGMAMEASEELAPAKQGAAPAALSKPVCAECGGMMHMYPFAADVEDWEE